MRRAVTNRRSAAEVEAQVKASSRKLEKLHWKLQELNARSMPAQKDDMSGREAACSPQAHPAHSSIQSTLASIWVRARQCLGSWPTMGSKF